MRSLTPHVKVRWYWLLLAAAVAANVYGFVGFPDLTDPEMSEAAALVSGGREPPPPALLEPYVTVSRHTAPTVRRGVEARRCQ